MYKATLSLCVLPAVLILQLAGMPSWTRVFILYLHSFVLQFLLLPKTMNSKSRGASLEPWFSWPSSPGNFAVSPLLLLVTSESSSHPLPSPLTGRTVCTCTHWPSEDRN